LGLPSGSQRNNCNPRHLLDGKNNLIFVRGELPDWVICNSRDFGYILQRVLTTSDGECLPCKLYDPQRAGWAIFPIFDDGSVGKRELFGNDLLAVTSALEPPIERSFPE
jgi:hypothetical protein